MNIYYNRQGEEITFDEFMAKLIEVGDDLEKWAEWRRVARTELSDGTVVSTVFLAHNHAFGGETPILFETMVFGADDSDQDSRRYCTEAEAVQGHEEVVREWSREAPTG